MTRLEYALVGLFALLCIVGISHGAPLPNVVNDEMYFVGGPLRAIAEHTIVPLPGDVPYGTITYLVNYVAWLMVLPVLLLAKGFDLTAVQVLLLLHPFAGYTLTRLVSVLALCALMVVCLRSRRYNPWLVFITFTNILVLSLAHTGKVWIISTVLYCLALHFLQRVFLSDNQITRDRDAFWGLVLTWLAFANFPLMGLSFVSYPFLLYAAFKKQINYKSIYTASLVGGVIMLATLALNASTILSQVSSIFNDYSNFTGHASYGLSFFQSLPLNVLKVFLLFPLHIFFLLLVAYRGFESRSMQASNRFLFTHVAVYLVVVSLLVSWSVETYSYLRYLLPLPIILMMIISTYKPLDRRAYAAGALVSFLFALRLVWLLALPLSYNQALLWTWDNLSLKSATLYNQMNYDFDLPHNASSSALMQESQCGSVCQFDRVHGTYQHFLPIVVDEHTDPEKLAGASSSFPGERYLYLPRPTSTGTLVASFITSPSDSAFPSLNFMGSYFDISFWRLERLGRNVYIYRQ